MRTLFGAAAGLALIAAMTGCVHEKRPAGTYQSYSDSTGVYQILPGADDVSTNGATAESRPTDSRPIITPDNGVNGKVSSVNADLRFVVLTFPAGRTPALNQRLSIYRRGLKVAEVNVTGPQRDDSIVADVVAGEAGLGDEVRSR